MDDPDPLSVGCDLVDHVGDPLDVVELQSQRIGEIHVRLVSAPDPDQVRPGPTGSSTSVTTCDPVSSTISPLSSASSCFPVPIRGDHHTPDEFAGTLRSTRLSLWRSRMSAALHFGRIIMAQLNPYLIFRGRAREAMEFYQAALGES